MTQRAEVNKAIREFADATEQSVTGTEPELHAAADRLARAQNGGATQLTAWSSHRPQK